MKKQNKRQILSLFANIGVAEAYLEDIGFHVAVANEVVERRAKLYHDIYPSTNMVCGDITNPDVYDSLIEESRKAGVDIVMATPPCQGMSTAGLQKEDDERNLLVIPAINAIKDLRPEYALMENVQNFINTTGLYKGKNNCWWMSSKKSWAACMRYQSTSLTLKTIKFLSLDGA